MKRLPFRRRLTVWSTLVAAVAIAICGVVAAAVVHHAEVKDVEADLQLETAHLFSELNRHGGARFDWKKIGTEMGEWLPQRNPPRMMELREGGKLRWRSPNLPDPGFASENAGLRNIRVHGERVRLLVTEKNGVTFAIGAALEEADALARGVVLAMLAGLPIALAIAWLGGSRLAKVAVRPVQGMTSAIEHITAERLDQRVPVPPVEDEIQRHARALNATLDRLEQSYQQAVRFSADASHELKTPLTVMRASIEAVLDSPSLGDNDRAAIASLLEQTRRLSEITGSLLLLARADSGRLVLDLAEDDLAALTEACAEDARISAERHEITVECDLPPTASARVEALRFAQIVSNLLDNAVKYNREGGCVRVTLRDEGSAWRLIVGNTGPGIAPELRERLFERFFRAEHTAERPGHGLGLSLSRELARAHGGDIAVTQSAPDWIEFAVTLPKAGPSQSPSLS